MEISKEYLQREIKRYRFAAEKFKADSLVNKGAADALEILLRELEKEEKPAQ